MSKYFVKYEYITDEGISAVSYHKCEDSAIMELSYGNLNEVFIESEVKQKIISKHKRYDLFKITDLRPLSKEELVYGN